MEGPRQKYGRLCEKKTPTETPNRITLLYSTAIHVHVITITNQPFCAIDPSLLPFLRPLPIFGLDNIPLWGAPKKGGRKGQWSLRWSGLLIGLVYALVWSMRWSGLCAGLVHALACFFTPATNAGEDKKPAPWLLWTGQNQRTNNVGQNWKNNKKRNRLQKNKGGGGTSFCVFLSIIAHLFGRLPSRLLTRSKKKTTCVPVSLKEKVGRLIRPRKKSKTRIAHFPSSSHDKRIFLQRESLRKIFFPSRAPSTPCQPLLISSTKLRLLV